MILHTPAFVFFLVCVCVCVFCLEISLVEIQDTKYFVDYFCLYEIPQICKPFMWIQLLDIVLKQ